MLIKRMNSMVILLGLVGLQACEIEDEQQSFGHVFVNQATRQAITAADETQGSDSVYFMSKSETRSQVWKILEIDWDAYQLQNVATGKCLALFGKRDSLENAQVELAECEKSPSQYWSMAHKKSGGLTLSLTGSESYLGLNPLCHAGDVVNGEGLCDRLVVVSASEAASFNMIQVEIDVEPACDNGTQVDIDTEGDDGTQDDIDSEGDDGTQVDNDSEGDDGTLIDEDPEGDDSTV